MIQYGAWDRLDDNKPFLAGYGEKPDVCNYYPLDITEAEFNAFEDADKDSWYTVIRRNDDGSLKASGIMRHMLQKSDKSVHYWKKRLLWQKIRV